MPYTLEEQLRRFAAGARLTAMVGAIAAVAFILGRLTA